MQAEEDRSDTYFYWEIVRESFSLGNQDYQIFIFFF